MKKYIYSIAIAAFFITSCTRSTESDHGHDHNGQQEEHGDHEGHDDHPHDDHHQEEFTMDSDTLK